MPKSIDYKVKLYPAHKEGGFVVTKFDLFGGTYPEKKSRPREWAISSTRSRTLPWNMAKVAAHL